jgi:hypothetical protein
MAALAGACGFETSFDNTRYQCSPEGACPAEYRCSAGYCESTAPGDRADAHELPLPPSDASLADARPVDPGAPDAGADAAPPADAAPSAADAAPAVLFADSFDDSGLAGWQPWVHSGCTSTEVGGFLQLVFGSSAGPYCGADTQQVFDLRGRSVTLELAQGAIDDGFEEYVLLFNGDDQVQMFREQEGLTMQFRTSAGLRSTRTITNDTTAQRHWRIRESGGTVFWETSPDRVTWTQRHSAASPIDVSSLRLELAAGRFAGSGALTVRFDNVEVR